MPEEIQLPACNESGLVQFDIAIGASYCWALLNRSRVQEASEVTVG
jgi:hypothetical protein